MPTRLLQFLRSAWAECPPQVRTHARNWAIGLAALSLLGLFFPLLAVTLWLGLNSLILGRALIRSLIRPRPLLLAWPVLLRWSGGLALVGTLLLRTAIEPLLAQWIERALPPNLLFLGAILLVFPILLLLAFVVSVMGGALGAQLHDDPLRRCDFARLGIRAIWLSLACLLLLAALWNSLLARNSLLGLEMPGFLCLLSSFPWLMQRAGRLLAWSPDDASAVLFDRLLRGALVWNLPKGLGGQRLDLRAGTLSLAAFGFAASLQAMGVLAPLQATVLTGLVQIQNAFQHLPTAFLNGVRLPALGVSRRIVLVEWDSDSMRLAHTESSEPRVQAGVVRQLSSWDALRIILPAPTLRPVDLPDSRVVADLGEEDAGRALNDLPLLVEATRESARVVFQEPEQGVRLALLDVARFLDPDESRQDPESGSATSLEALRSAARERGSGWLASLHIPALPCLTLTSRTNPVPAIPWILHAAVYGPSNPPVPAPDGRSIRLDARRLPLIQPDHILVDLQKSTPAHDFTRVSYASILRGDPVFTGTGTGPRAWMPPADFFRDKLVFLEPIVPSLRATPLGELPRTELLAYATQTLLDGKPFEAASPAWSHSCALLLALAVGLASARSNPIRGSWRLLVGFIGLAAFSLWRALDDMWIDPVLPGSSALLAFLAVTQLTSTLDRLARDRHRGMLQRFVAPEIVADVLDRRDGQPELGGRREEVVVLFADVRGFTQFAEAHSPEEVMRTVNAYLAVLTDALNRHGGILDKYTGDGLMALFRLENQGPDRVNGAVQSALEMRDAALALSRDRTLGGDKSLRVGISLHVGEAVLGLVGNPTRQINFTALGHAVVVAARLQAVAGGGEVVITGELADRVSAAFQLEERAPLHAKGISRPLRVFHVQAAAPSQPRLP